MQANNHFSIVGNITRDPEIRLTKNATKYTFVTIAVNNIGKDKPADFISVLCWDKLAENIKAYCHKGDCVAICGVIGTRKSEDNKKTEYVFTADSFTICRTPQKKEAPAAAPEEKPSGDVVADAIRHGQWNQIDANPYGVDFPG